MQTYDISKQNIENKYNIVSKRTKKSCKTTSENRQKYKQNRCQTLKIWLPKV